MVSVVPSDHVTVITYACSRRICEIGSKIASYYGTAAPQFASLPMIVTATKLQPGPRNASQHIAGNSRQTHVVFAGPPPLFDVDHGNRSEGLCHG